MKKYLAFKRFDTAIKNMFQEIVIFLLYVHIVIRVRVYQ